MMGLATQTMAHARDTSPEMERIYRARLAALTPAERIQMMIELTLAGEAMYRAGLERRFPRETPDQISYRIAAARIGPEAAARAFPPG